MANQKQKFTYVSPFQGEPETVFRHDPDDGEKFEVTIRELTPEGAKAADSMAGLTCMILWIFMFIVNPGAGLIFGTILAALTHKGFVSSFRDSKKVTTRVVFTATELRVEQNWDWHTLDRTLSHRFIVLEHDKAREEREMFARSTQKAQMEGRVTSNTRYFDDSAHIVFEYLGHRVDLATVFDRKRALAVAARLKACDEVMNAKTGMGDGQALNPGAQWGSTPGGLPGI